MFVFSVKTYLHEISISPFPYFDFTTVIFSLQAAVFGELIVPEEDDLY